MLINRFKQPFPDQNNFKKQLISYLGIGAFVSLFLYIIRPFGIGNIPKYMELICLGFGLVTIVFGSIFELTGRYIFKLRTDLPSWTLGKWIIQVALLILWIALGNYLYMNFLMNWNMFDLSFLIQMLGNTLIIGIFPIVFSGLIIQLRASKNYQNQAAQIQHRQWKTDEHQDKVIHFTAETNQELKIAVDAIYYIEAMQNYVCVYHKEGAEIKRSILRNTLSNIESLLEGTTVIRCHRSFLVNLGKIEQVKGNAQGLKLSLKEIDKERIPVSRSFINSFKAQLA